MPEPLPSGLENSGHLNEITFPLALSGRYRIDKWYDSQGKSREFACRSVTVSAWSMTLAAPVLGLKGRRVTAHMEAFGRIEGTITQVLSGMFDLAVELPERRRAQVHTRLLWIYNQKRKGLPDRRSSARVMPESPHSTLILPTGAFLPCLVIDMSATGAAISADFYPEVGQTVIVGKVVGEVVRRFAEGFAVRFLQARDPSKLEEMLTGAWALG